MPSLSTIFSAFVDHGAPLAGDCEAASCMMQEILGPIDQLSTDEKLERVVSALRRLALSGVHWKHQFDSASAEVAQLKQQAAYREWKAKSRDKYHKIMLNEERVCHLRQDLVYSLRCCPKCYADLTILWRKLEAFLAGVRLNVAPILPAASIADGNPYYEDLSPCPEIRKLLYATEDKLTDTSLRKRDTTTLAALAITSSGLGQRTLYEFNGHLQEAFGSAVSQEMYGKIALMHAEVNPATSAKELMARICRVLRPLLKRRYKDVEMDQWLFEYFVAFASKLPVEKDGILSEMLAPDSDENGSLPLMLTKLRQCLMDWLDNPDNFVIDAFFSSLSSALGDLRFEEYASKATLDKLRALYKVPIFGFHFRHFLKIAEQCAQEVPDVPDSSMTFSRVAPFAGAPQSSVYGHNVSGIPSMFAGSAQLTPPGSALGPASNDYAMTSPQTYEAANWCELQPTTSQQASYAGCPPPHLNDGSALQTAQPSAYPGMCYSWQNGDVHDVSEY